MFMQALLIFFNILPDFSYTVPADIDVIVLYEGTMFMHAMLMFFNILLDFSYTVQADSDVIVLYKGTMFMHEFSYSVLPALSDSDLRKRQSGIVAVYYTL